MEQAQQQGDCHDIQGDDDGNVKLVPLNLLHRCSSLLFVHCIVPPEIHTVRDCSHPSVIHEAGFLQRDILSLGICIFFPVAIT